jgi:hypothetical protein
MNPNRLITALLLLLITAHLAPGVGVEADGPALKLTTTVVSQEYRRGEISALKMRLRLRFTNTGERTVILRKDCAVVRYFISRTAGDAAAQKYVTHGRFTIRPNTKHEPPDGAAPGEDFIILRKGESHEAERELTIVLSVDGEGGVREGDYVLQVTTWTWFDSEKVAQRLRERWQELGYLWSDAVTSEPMVIKF